MTFRLDNIGRIRGMLYTMIQKNCYMDSVELMVLSRKLGERFRRWRTRRS